MPAAQCAAGISLEAIPQVDEFKYKTLLVIRDALLVLPDEVSTGSIGIENAQRKSDNARPIAAAKNTSLRWLN